METTATNWRIRKIVTELQSGEIVPRPYFQRRLVWSNKDKSKFIETILKKYPFPEIYVADGAVDVATAAGSYLVVDGQQRVTTIYEYFSGNLEGIIKYGIEPYENLNEDRKRDFLNYNVAVRDLGNVDEVQIKEVFQRINATNYSLNDMEVNNALYGGSFKAFCERIARDSFFDDQRFFRPLQMRRMGDVKYIVILVSTMMHGYFNRDSEIEEYLRRYNDEFERSIEIQSRFEAVRDFIKAMKIPNESRAWKQTDFYTLFIELDKLLKTDSARISPSKVKNHLYDFYKKVDSDSGDENDDDKDTSTYAKAVLQAANDRVNRVRRGEIIRQVILNSNSDN